MNSSDVLISKAERLGQIAHRLGLHTLSSVIVDDTRRRLDEDRLRVAVIGEIKHGKSSLINALIGSEALPTGVTPTTGAVVRVHAGDEPGPWLDKGEGQRERLEPDRFAALARGPDKNRGNGNAGEHEDGALELVVSPDVLPSSLELVDTPGINDIAQYRAAVSRGELPRADVLVLVLDATQLLNRAEMAFLRDAVTSVGGLQDSGARLVLVVNRIDLIAERERPKLAEHLERELASIGKRPTPRDGSSDDEVETGSVSGSVSGSAGFDLYFTDARTASRDPSADTIGVQAVRDLRGRLIELTESRADMLPLRAKASLLRYGTLLAHNASIAARAIQLELDALTREIETVQRELADHQADMTRLRRTMSDARDRILADSFERADTFRNTLMSSISACIDGASQRTLSSHLAGAIHDAFVAFAHQEAERLRAALDEVTRQAIHTHSEQARRRLFRATMRLGFRGPTVYIDPPSVALEAGMVAIGLAGTAVMYFGNLVAGMLMTIAGPLATVVLREKSLRDARARAKSELPGALDRASEALRDQIRKVVDGHLAALDEHLLLANVALGEQLSGVLERARDELGTHEGETTNARRARAQQELNALELELGRIRTELSAVSAA